MLGWEKLLTFLWRWVRLASDLGKNSRKGVTVFIDIGFAQSRSENITFRILELANISYVKTAGHEC